MENHHHHQQLEIGEPVRSRWTPKPEQILILESIFNSGMVNPPKDETARIRRMLQKFGDVADANVFYWFQNRRSRSRRRQRQIQSSAGDPPPQAQQPNNHILQFDNYTSFPTNLISFGSEHALSFSGDSSTARVPEYDQSSQLGVLEASDLYHFQLAETITVMINGVATEVGTGPLDLKAMFGEEMVLYHSSGLPVEVNESGVLLHALNHGHSYFLVPRHC